MEALQQDPIEGLVVSQLRVSEVASEAVRSNKHFTWVAETDGEVKGAMLVLVNPSMLYERSEATVVMLFVKNGDGLRMIREFMRWFESKRGIRQMNITGTGNQELDKRLVRLFKKRYGFNDDVVYLYKVKRQ